MNRNLLLRITLSVACLLLVGAPALAQSQRVTGTVVGISGRLAGRTRPLTLIVNHYTTGGDLSDLNQSLQGGQDRLLGTLSHMNAGRIQIGNNVGVTANAIIATPWGDGGTRLTVLYQRDVSFYELRYGTRSENYKFGYAELF